MKSTLSSPWIYIVILAAGLFFKANKIGYKHFWFDEVATIGHTSGNQLRPPQKDVILPITDYKDMLRINGKYTLGSQVKGLVTSTNLNPLHYPFLMVWIRLLGDEPVSYRWFNVFVFLLTLPLLFVLAKRLFKNELAGWVAVSLYACSPYINFFTHEARYHVTWAFFIMLTCYSYLKALDKSQIKWWIVYVAAATCSLHISLISFPVLAGIFLWGFIYYKQRRVRIFISSAIGVLLFLPWLIHLITNREEISNALAWHSFLGEKVSVFKLLFMQFYVPATSFGVPGDFMSNRFPKPNFNPAELITLYPFLLIILAIVFLTRKRTEQAGTFLAFAFLSLVLFFVGSDMVRGVGGSMTHRYQTINVVAAILLLTYLFSNGLAHGKWLFFAGYLVLIGMGIFTMVHNSRNPVWDMPGPHRSWVILEEGAFYSSKDSPLIISDFGQLPMGLGFNKFLEISNSIKSERIDILYASPDIRHIDSLIHTKHYSDIFVSFSSDNLVNHLKTELGERMQPVDQRSVAPVWKIESLEF